MIYRVFSLCLLVSLIGLLGCAQSPASQGQTPSSAPTAVMPIRTPQLYEQCASLQTNNDAVPAAIAALKDKDTQKRIKAANALAKNCDSRATQALIAALKDEDVFVRIAVVEALGQLGDRAAIEPLIETISDSDWRVRTVLARTLASFKLYESNNATLNALVNPADKTISEEGDLRARCIGILVVNQMRDVRFSRKAIGFLFLFLDHKEPSFRRLAEETALELKNTRNGYHELIGILKQNNYPDFRRKAAYWLGKFKMEEAREALTEAATNDRDASVKKTAQEALAEMKTP